jgi:hypothetical protein
MQIVATQQRMEVLHTQERLERIEDELEELNIRLDAVIEAVKLLAPTRYNAPWSENRVAAELHRARHT